VTVRPRSIVSAPTAATLGLGLLVAAATWWAASAMNAGVSPVPGAAMFLGAMLVVVASRAAAARASFLALMAIVGVAAVVLAAGAASTLRSGPTQGPFGYANATAAFVAQACVAALMLVVLARGSLRVVGVVAAAGFAGLLLVTETWTVVVGLPFLGGLALGAARLRGGIAPVAACAAVFGVVLVATIVLGAIGAGRGFGPVDRVIGRTLSEERVVLWNEALAIAAEHPLIGVGPGRFALESPLASSDPDLRWAHHEFLQAGAETGLVGYALAVAIFLWGFVALAGVPAGPVPALAAAALAVLGVHACVDYVLRFPAVTLAGAAVLGAGLGAATTRTAGPGAESKTRAP
jgi:O-antigen ligase